MDSKIIIVIAIVVSAMSTAGIMYLVGFEQQSEIIREQSPPEIVYVEKPASEYFEGTHDIKKIASQEELKNILEASAALFGERSLGSVNLGDRTVSNIGSTSESVFREPGALHNLTYFHRLFATSKPQNIQLRMSRLQMLTSQTISKMIQNTSTSYVEIPYQ